MDPCIQKRTGYYTTGVTITVLRTCTIPGPLYYTQSLSVTATATSYRGAISSNTASCTIKVDQKPPGPNPDPNQYNWGLILGISIPAAILLILILCCCCKKKSQPLLKNKQYS